MQNLYKILILVMLFTMTNNALSQNKASDSQKNWFDNYLGIQISGGLSDVYGSVHDLAPISGDHDFGHLTIGFGFFDTPIEYANIGIFCINAHVNYGSIATLEGNTMNPMQSPIQFGRDTETTYYIGATYRFFPLAGKGNRGSRGC